MDDSHKKTWNNFTKFVLWGTIAVILILVFNGYILAIGLKMRIGSIQENQKMKKISITQR